MIFFVQGSYLAEEESRVSVLDRGFLYGDSVYETMRIVQGRILFFEEHRERLQRSAERLGIEIVNPEYDLLEVVTELVRRNRIEEAQVRVIVTRGIGGRDQLAGFRPTWIVEIESFVPMPEEQYRAGVGAVLVSIVRHGVDCLDPAIKSSNLLNTLLARREAIREGATEGIMTNPEGHLAEGAHTNLFWVGPDRTVRTPALSVGILPGVTRQKVIECARAGRIPLEEVACRPEALDDAEEIFLTSTTLEVLAVTIYNGRVVGSAREGETTRCLRQALRRLYSLQEGKRK